MPRYGAGLLEKVRQNAALLCVCTIGIGCILALAASLFLDELLQLLHAKGRILPMQRVICPCFFFLLLLHAAGIVSKSMLVAAGRPLLGMVLAICAGGVNVVLDVVFMAGFHMGIEGSALATGIAIWCRRYMERCFSCKGSKRSCIFSRPVWDIKCWEGKL